MLEYCKKLLKICDVKSICQSNAVAVTVPNAYTLYKLSKQKSTNKKKVTQTTKQPSEQIVKSLVRYMISAALSGACIEWQNAGPQWRALLECSLPQRRVVRVVRQMPELPQGDVPAGGGPLLHLLRRGYRGRVQHLRSVDTSGS